MVKKIFKAKKIYIIAGEPSGDLLGGKLISALKAQNNQLEIYGVGGANMQAAGLNSLFPMESLAVMGLVEILSEIPRLLKRIREIERDILAKNPDVIIMIDSQTLSCNIAKRLKKHHHPATRILYVAPTIWAWRKNRIKKYRKLFHQCLCLYPFEESLLSRQGLPATYVGHPMLEDDLSVKAQQIPDFVAAHRLETDKEYLVLLPGSRRKVCTRHLPLFLEVFTKLKQQNPKLRALIPTLPHLRVLIKEHPDCILVDAQTWRWHAFLYAKAALSVSGTATLELSYAKTPMIIAYRGNRISEMIIRLLIRIPYVGMPNILNYYAGYQEQYIPEYLGKDCQVEPLFAAMENLLADTRSQDTFFAHFHKNFQTQKDIKPSAQAANTCLGTVAFFTGSPPARG